MASREGDRWSEIVASGGVRQPHISVVYGRRRVEESTGRRTTDMRGSFGGEQRPSFAPSKRTSWNRSLSIRGRESIFVAPGANLQPQKNCRALKQPPKPCNRVKKNVGGPPDFRKEKAYFAEVDACDLMEESPSPKNFGTWTRGMDIDHDLPAILERWQISKLAMPVSSKALFDIIETPVIPSVLSNCSTSNNLFSNSCRTPEKDRGSGGHTMGAIPLGFSDIEGTNITASLSKLNIKGGPVETSIPWNGEALTAFDQILMVCKQSAPVTLAEVFSAYCELGSIKKLGEGTYGEAYRAGRTVCKVVPFDGDLLVNGETQKRSEEILGEVLLSLTLNNLRSNRVGNEQKDSCDGFIETRDFRVCQGPYDPSLISAWEDFDAKRGSENDHPKDFTREQCYIVFVLADGGTDLESYALVDYNEAHSLLVQVTASLAVAESACEFEHRDLHWGNILLTQDDTPERNNTMSFILGGKRMHARTFGLTVSIIDFTLSRINTANLFCLVEIKNAAAGISITNTWSPNGMGNLLKFNVARTAILFLDLSADPALFQGKKGDKQAETYRRMKEITKEHWEGSYPKTNVVWLIYLVDMVLQKMKPLAPGNKVERELRSFKKRLASYESAGDCLADPFFADVLLTEDERLSFSNGPSVGDVGDV
ncbi:hypothetical protein U9M48_016000 [Paspalum notatum var. saurae]|uniref:non-specific serine/threonine protein kinase n=1 Tax=Paspalum notatum var. saurae TaxID=547442 RepID=A0AAQ3T480_PASNO